jgi:putative oxidoreductase
MAPEDAGIFLIRAVTGGFFFCHGGMMLFGWFGGSGFARTKSSFDRMGFRPLVPFAIAAPATQLVCGALVVTGILWPIGPALLVGPMTVAVVRVHWPRIWVTEQGIEFPLVMGAVMFGLGLLPAGEISIDNWLNVDIPQRAAFWASIVMTEAVTAVALFTSWRVRKARALAAPASEAPVAAN